MDFRAIAQRFRCMRSAGEAKHFSEPEGRTAYTVLGEVDRVLTIYDTPLCDDGYGK